jgi:superfamily II DNA or RNA helicase
MQNLNGYIYIRFHESYDKYDVCKMGKATNIPERDSGYIPGEFVRGKFVIAFGIYAPNTSDKIEKILQNHFKHLNIVNKNEENRNGGGEFFHKTIVDLIEPFLQVNNIKHIKLSSQDIKYLIRTQRIRKITDKINKTKLMVALKRNSNERTPRIDQLSIIEKTTYHFSNNKNGILILPCGVGKTLISLWSVERIGCKTILIGVPNDLLLRQWEKELKFMFGYPCLVVCKGVYINDIEEFLIENKYECIVITTYSSSHKVKKATLNAKFVFMIKINDECHHLSSTNISITLDKRFINMLKIQSVKQLSLTATIKNVEGKDTISNNNIDLFGQIIHKKCLLEAIQEKTVCDYEILTTVVDDDFKSFDIKDNDDKRLLITAYLTLKSILEGHIHHALIYANSRKNSERIMEHIQNLLSNKYFQIPGLYYSDYDGSMNYKKQESILKYFRESSKGIISCVYCLGEGWDFPLLNGVVFAENMSSNIRIVQSALRASRKNRNEPHKTTKIVIPILYQEDWYNNNDNCDFQKVKEIVYQMGLEDVTIEQKIKVFEVKGLKPRAHGEQTKPEYLGDYDDLTTKEIRLKCIQRATFGISYEKAKRIIADHGVKNKEEYFDLCCRDIRLPNDPEEDFKGSFKNWIDYLGIKQEYYDLVICKKKIDEYLKLYPKIKEHYPNMSLICEKICELDSLFPPSGLWIDYYKVNNVNQIINEIESDDEYLL